MIGRTDRLQGASIEGVTEWTYDDAPGKGIGKLHTIRYTPTTGEMPVIREIRYDNLGRPNYLSENVDTLTYYMGTTYDGFSRVSTVRYPTGFTTKNTYDGFGYLQKIERSDASGPVYWRANQYDQDGHITLQQLGNGVVTQRTYVPQTGMLHEIQSSLNGSDTVQNLEYHFDAIGNL